MTNSSAPSWFAMCSVTSPGDEISAGLRWCNELAGTMDNESISRAHSFYNTSISI